MEIGRGMHGERAAAGCWGQSGVGKTKLTIRNSTTIRVARDEELKEFDRRACIEADVEECT